MKAKIAQLHVPFEDVETVVLLRGDKSSRKEDFVVAGQEDIGKLCKMKQLTGQDLRVYFACWANADWGNYVWLHQVEIAEYMGIDKRRVSTSFKKLITNGLLFRYEVNGRLKGYRVSSVFLWKGKTDREYKRTYKHDEEQLALLNETVRAM